MNHFVKLESSFPCLKKFSSHGSHGFEDVSQLGIFCIGLRFETKMILDAATRGAIMTVDVEQVTKTELLIPLPQHSIKPNIIDVQLKGEGLILLHMMLSWHKIGF